MKFLIILNLNFKNFGVPVKALYHWRISGVILFEFKYTLGLLMNS